MPSRGPAVKADEHYPASTSAGPSTSRQTWSLRAAGGGPAAALSGIGGTADPHDLGLEGGELLATGSPNGAAQARRAGRPAAWAGLFRHEAAARDMVAGGR